MDSFPASHIDPSDSNGSERKGGQYGSVFSEMNDHSRSGPSHLHHTWIGAKCPAVVSVRECGKGGALVSSTNLEVVIKTTAAKN